MGVHKNEIFFCKNIFSFMYQWGTQVRKFRFVKNNLHGNISGSTQEKYNENFIHTKNHFNEQVEIKLQNYIQFLV